MAGVQQKARVPSIPIPRRDDMQSMHETVMALKLLAEMQMGTRGETPLTHTFVTEKVPLAFVSGDLWVQPSTGHVSYWDGNRWQLTKANP